MKKVKKKVPAVPARRSFEGSLADVLRDFEHQEFESIDEMKGYLDDIAAWFNIDVKTKTAQCVEPSKNDNAKLQMALSVWVGQKSHRSH